MKKSEIFATAAVFAAGIAAAAVGEVYRSVFCRRVGPVLKPVVEKKTHEAEYYAFRDTSALLAAKLPHEEYSMRSQSGVELKGFYYQWGAKPSQVIAVIVHGYRSEHLETVGMFLDYYRSRGIDIFCADNAGSGESRGRLIEWSVRESRDILQWLAVLNARIGSDTQIILHGFSMGAATVLQTSDRCPDNIAFIVSDSAFSSAEEIIHRSVGKFCGLLFALNRAISGVDLKYEGDVGAHVKNAKVPIIFIHGAQDPTIPYTMTQELYKRCPTEKDLFIVEDALHIEGMFRAPLEYARRLDAFRHRYCV